MVTEAACKQFEAKEAEMTKGGYAIIAGPLKEQQGALVVPASTKYVETAVELESMNYPVEGVVGVTS
jgi:simple sugar transport system substrate-binding protein